MIYIRKVNQVNRSLTVVLPTRAAEYLGIVKGNYVVLKRVTFGKTPAVLVEKLDTKKLESEERNEG